MKKLIVAVVAVAVSGVFALRAEAAPKIWKGGSSGDWFVADNWDPSGVPSATDVVTFNGSATVNVNQAGDAELWCFSVNAGEVKITGVEGARLVMKSDTAGNGQDGWNVQKGAKLDIGVATLCNNRVDKWYGGELWFHAPLDIRSIAFFGYGTNVFARGSSVQVVDTFYVGLGKSDTGLRDCVIFTDDATFNGWTISFTGSDNCSTNVLEVDGDGVSITVEKFNLNGYSATDDQFFYLKRGSFTVNNSFCTEESADVRPGHVLMTGGNLIVRNDFRCHRGTVRVEGGTLDFGGEPIFDEGTFLDLAGGEYVPTYLANKADKGFRLDEKIHVSGEKVGFLVPVGCVMYWDFDNAVIEDRTKIVKRGVGDLLFAKSQTVSRPLEVRIGTATVASGVTLTAPAGSDEAWSLLVADTAEFRLTDITSRLSLPIDVSILGTGAVSGRFVFPSDAVRARGLVIARSLTVDFAEWPKGRYSVGNCDFISGAAGCSLVVPYRWTGAGDGVSFASDANWADGEVPPSATTTPIDLSSATRVAVDGDYTLTSVLYVPTGADRKSTLSVSGTLTLDSPDPAVCAVYVKDGTYLALEATKISRGSVSTSSMSILGGGTVSMKGDFPALLGTQGDTGFAPFTIDGTLAFNGKSTIYKCDQNPSDYNMFALFGHEQESLGRMLIEDGADIAVRRLYMSPVGNPGLAEIRQTGGTATFDNVYLEKYEDGATVEYVLEGGTLNVTGGKFNLSSTLSDTLNPRRRPGPSFRMTGGTLNLPYGFGIEGHQNRVRLSGGTVCSAGLWHAAKTEPMTYAVEDFNTDIFYFGGVTFNDQATSEAERLTFSSDTVLTGIGGDTVFNVSDNWTVLGQPGVNITGPGGVVANGLPGTSTALFWIRGNINFTGGITVNTPYRCYLGNGCAGETFNGPRFLKVTHPDCLVFFMGAVTKAPEVISVPSWWANTDHFWLVDYAAGEMHVKRFIVNGVDMPVGSYAVQGGSIVVDAPESSWLSGDKGDLTYKGDSVVTEAVTLSSLRYAPFEEGQAATLSGSATVTLAADSVIEVTEGQVLVVTAPVVLAGKVRKTGFGRVVFAGPVTGDTGSLDVENGALDIRDVFADSIGITVRANSSLMGTATFGSSVAFEDGATVTTFDGSSVGLSGWVVLGGKLNVEGAGTLLLSGVLEGAAGAINVAGGTLDVRGTVAPSVPVAVSRGAFLAGDGLLGGNVTLADGAGLALTVAGSDALEIGGGLLLGDAGVFRVDGDGGSLRKHVVIRANGALYAPEDFAGWSYAGSASGVCIVRDGNGLLLKKNGGFLILAK